MDRHKRSLAKWALPTLLAGVLASNLGLANQALADDVPAAPAFRFVDSVGVASHFAWKTSPYRTHYAKAKAALSELGIRHIRDDAGNKSAMEAFRDLYTSLKLRIVLVVGRYTGTGASQRLNPDGISSVLASLRQDMGADALSALEGPNEYNLLERDYGYMGWPQDLLPYQAELFRQVKADSQLSSKPVLAPTMGGPNEAYYYNKAGDYSAIADYSSAHVYPNWLPAAQKIAQLFPSVKAITNNKNVWITENGWHDAVNSGKQFVPQNVITRYLTRAMAEFSARNDIKRGHFYQLIDPFYDPHMTNPGAQKGLLDYNMNKKPSFYAVRNMMHILCDNELKAPPASLNYTLSGNLTDVRSKLFQKNNGTFALLLWLEKQLYNKSGPILNTPQSVSIQFGQPVSRVRRYLPSDPHGDLTVRNRPVQTYAVPTRIALQVPDQITVLEIVPKGVVTPVVSTSCNFAPST